MIRTTAALALALLAATHLAAAEEAFRNDIAQYAPFSREVDEGGSATFSVLLRSGWYGPVFSMTRPSGETTYVRPIRQPGGASFEFDVIFDAGPGEYRLELVVDSAKGDHTAAQFSIFVGVKRPPEGEEEKRRPEEDYPPERPDEDPVRLERDFLRMVNAFRKTRGLEPFPWLEPGAILARDHLADFLALKPRPKDLIHVIPGKGCIADRFAGVYRWPTTVRKFPIEHPDIGPEAACYCSESLAAPRSLTWLFREFILRESAFLAPIISTYPTHAAVGIVREKESGRLFTAFACIQVNSTRVRTALEAEWKETVRQEEKAEDGPDRAEFLRRLGRLGDPRATKTFMRRLTARLPEVRAAALDALYLTDLPAARGWVEEQNLKLVRARRLEQYGETRPILVAFSLTRYDAATRVRGAAELAEIERLSEVVLADGLVLAAEGRLAEARESLALVAGRFEGFPAAEQAATKLKELEAAGPR